MSDTQPMSADDFRDLFARLRGYDFADWSRSALERIAAAEEWTIGNEKYPKLAVAPPLLGGSLDPGYQGADFQQLSLTVSKGDTLENFHRLVAVGAEEIGHEPPIWGGPGPFVRWRQDGVSFADPGTSIEIAYSHGRIELIFYATQVYEYYWMKAVEWGSGIHDPFPSWMVTIRHDSLAGMGFPGGRVVFTWKEFEEALGNLIGSLVHDVPGMGDGMSLILAPRNEPERYVRFIVDDEADLIMEASAELDASERPDDQTMKRLGWHDQAQREPPNWWQGYSRPSSEECAAAAKLIVETLQAYGVELADEDDWMDDEKALTYIPNYVGGRARGYFDLWGLYLPR